MKVGEYSYSLPKAKIAQHPPKTRGDAKLLVLDKSSGKITDRTYADVIEYLNPGDVLVLNNTKVIKARLIALGSDGKHHEILLTEKHGHEDEAFHHKAIYRGKLVDGMELTIGKTNIKVVGVYNDGTALLESPIDFMQLAEKYGHVPLPPYMKREDSLNDVKRYQTEFSTLEGSVAAPTASLNMTNKLIKNIESKGIKICYITLHVGLGTFMPIRSSDITKHKMHSEWFHIPKETVLNINKAKQHGNNIMAVGTTVARTLEYNKHELANSLEITGEADIFIFPGYKFEVINSLLTNFHAPKSTVLMLTAAFAGVENLDKAYSHALSNDYRFLSYGDSMLII